MTNDLPGTPPAGSAPPTGPAPGGRRVSRAEAERLVQEHAQAGRLDPAITIQERIAVASPKEAVQHHRLAMLYLRAGRLPAAAAALQKTAELAPGQPQVLTHLGEVLRRLGRLDEAVAANEQARAAAPDRPDVLVNLAAALLDRREAEPAIPLLQKALARDAGLTNGHVNLGNAYRMQGQLPQAIEAYRTALSQQADNVDALGAMGLCVRDLGELAEARALLEKAVGIAPRHGNARSALAILNLLEGRFAEGWRDYEARWGSSELKPRPMPIEPWRGEALDGRHLFVFAEQGHGDTIHFARYLPRLAEAGARVTCEVQKPVLGLLAQSFPEIAFIERGQPLPQADFAVPLLSLPGRFGTDLSNMPADCPYLQVQPEVLGQWRRRLDELAPRQALRIGLCWGGSKTHRTDFLRSLTPAALGEAFLALPDARFFSLQFGERQPEIAGWPGRDAQSLTDLAPELGDFAHTAGALAALDLIVTVDTATAHLAGALARPTHVLLAHVPDWRWLLDRSDSPWYPSLTLYRQPATGDWQGALGPAVAATAEAASGLIERRERERKTDTA